MTDDKLGSGSQDVQKRIFDIMSEDPEQFADTAYTDFYERFQKDNVAAAKYSKYRERWKREGSSPSFKAKYGPNTRQCCGRLSGTNPPIRCGYPALKGRDFCQQHGGRHKKGAGKFTVKDNLAIYSRHAGTLLRERLQELAKLSPEERHSLSEEIDLARALAVKSLKMYEAVHSSSKATPDMKILVGNQLQKALDFVSRVAVAASKVRAVSQSTVDVEQLDYIVRQVTRIIEEEIADYDREMADRVVNRLRDIKLPDRHGGTAMSPEELAQELRKSADTIMGGIIADPPSEEKSDAD